MIQSLGSTNNFTVDATEDASQFSDSNLGEYRAVVFLCTTGDILDATQQAAFERYIRAGGGYAGIHSASDTEYTWPWYGLLVGAYFQSHPAIQTQRDQCCHSGGSLTFGPEGDLFISAGDNTNPFESDGYVPIDERAGRSAWDSQKSAGNANDLRGKILRIHPQADGTYTIPPGNLFPSGTPNTRPEI